MNSCEKEEISRLPSQYRPLGAWGYFWYTILFAIPFIGWIAWIVCACSASNINRRSFARSYACGIILVLIIVLAITLLLPLLRGALDGIIEPLKEYIEQLIGSLG